MKQTYGNKKTSARLSRRESALYDESGHLSENIALDCGRSGDVERLKKCFENPKDVYHSTVHTVTMKRGVDDGKAALDWAALLDRADVVSLLINNGIDINATNCKGYTALHFGCAWGRACSVKELLEGGASTDLLTNNNERAIDIAHRYSHGNCVELIELYEMRKQYKADVQSTKELVARNSKIFTKAEKTSLNAAIKSELEWLSSAEARTEALCDVIKRKQVFDSRVQPLFADKTLLLPPGEESSPEPESRKVSGKQKKKGKE